MNVYELDAAMRWIFHHGTALIVMSNIIGKFGLKYGPYFSRSELLEDETIFYPRIDTVRPLLSRGQIKSSLKKLESFGFIKILGKHYNGYKLKVIINPFNYEVSKKIANAEGYRTGWSWFGE